MRIEDLTRNDALGLNIWALLYTYDRSVRTFKFLEVAHSSEFTTLFCARVQHCSSHWKSRFPTH